MGEDKSTSREVRRILREIRTLLKNPSHRRHLMNALGKTWLRYLMEAGAFQPHLFHTSDGWVETDLTDPQVHSTIPFQCSPAMWNFLRELSICTVSTMKPKAPVVPRTPADALLFHALLRSILSDSSLVESLSGRVVSPLTEFTMFSTWEPASMDFSFFHSDMMWPLIEDDVLRQWVGAEWEKMQKENPEEVVEIATRQVKVFRQLREIFSSMPHRLTLFMHFYQRVFLFRESEELGNELEMILETLRKKLKRQRLLEMEKERKTLGEVFGVPFWTDEKVEDFQTIFERLRSIPPYAQDAPTRLFLEEYARFRPVEEQCRILYQRFTRVIM